MIDKIYLIYLEPHFVCLEKFIVTSNTLIEHLRVLTFSSSPSIPHIHQSLWLNHVMLFKKKIISASVSPLDHVDHFIHSVDSESREKGAPPALDLG